MTIATGPGNPGNPNDPGDDPEERDPGLARERTILAWRRTAITFAALGAAVLKANVITGLVVLAIVPLIWQLAEVTRGGSTSGEMPVIGPVRLFAITVAIVGVAVACLVIALVGASVPGALS